MAVDYDAISVRTSTSVSNPSWTHTPVGTPRGIIVYVMTNTATDEIGSVTYGGVAMAELASSHYGGPNPTTWFVHAFFLGSGIPTGAQTVVVTKASGNNIVGYAVSVTAASDTVIVDEQQLGKAGGGGGGGDLTGTLTLGGVSCFCLEGWADNNANVSRVTPLTGWTSRDEQDVSPVVGCYTYDTVGTADVTFGLTQSFNLPSAIIGAAIGEDPDIALTIPVEDFTYETYAPSVAVDQIFNIPVVDFDYSILAPSVVLGVNFTIPVVNFNFSTQIPAVFVDQPFNIPTLDFTYTVNLPTFDVIEHVFKQQAFDFSDIDGNASVTLTDLVEGDTIVLVYGSSRVQALSGITDDSANTSAYTIQESNTVQITIGNFRYISIWTAVVTADDAGPVTISAFGDTADNSFMAAFVTDKAYSPLDVVANDDNSAVFTNALSYSTAAPDVGEHQLVVGATVFWDDDPTAVAFTDAFEEVMFQSANLGATVPDVTLAVGAKEYFNNTTAFSHTVTFSGQGSNDNIAGVFIALRHVSDINIDLSIPAVDYTFDVYAPNLAIDVVFDIPSRNYAYQTYTPDFYINWAFTAPIVDFGYAVYAPEVVVDVALNIPSVDFAYTVNAPVFALDHRFSIPSVDFAYNTAAPLVAINYNIDIPSIDFTFDAHTPSIFVDQVFDIPVEEYNYAVHIPQIKVATNFIIPVGDFTYSVYAPTIIADHETVIDILSLDLTPPRETNAELQRWLINNFTILQEVLKYGVTGTFETTNGEILVIRNGIVEQIYSP